MHVHTETVITAVEVIARLQAAAETDAALADTTRKLSCDAERVPPKVSLSGIRLLPPAAAEVVTAERSGATEVVLRLMWGPLPAPFPRALAAAGVLVAGLVLVVAAPSPLAWLGATLVAALPVAAWLYQRGGEQLMQERLNDVLQGSGFTPGPG